MFSMLGLGLGVSVRVRNNVMYAKMRTKKDKIEIKTNTKK